MTYADEYVIESTVESIVKCTSCYLNFDIEVEKAKYDDDEIWQAEGFVMCPHCGSIDLY